MEGRTFDNLTISISTILLILGLENYIQQTLYSFSVPLVLIGVAILLFGPKIVKDFNNAKFKKIFTNSVGLMCIIIGLDYFLESNIGNFGWVYIIVALVIFNYHGNVNKLVGPK